MVTTYPAPAKLNLDLRITGRRQDGYHTLESHMVLIDWCDEIAIAVRDDGVICRKTDLPAIREADDLAIKAAKLLQMRYQVRLGAEIGIKKISP